MMKTVDVDTVGQTAFVIAYMRLLETERLAPLALDPIAHVLLGDAGIELARPVAERSPVTIDLVAARTRYFDDKLLAALSGGCTQVVLLGAGLDARSMRIGSASYFEVDRPDVLAWKKRRLAAAQIEWPSRSVGCDYTEGDPFAALESAGLDRSKPVFVLWEGNSMYIPRAVIDRLFARLREALPRAVLAFDFLPHGIALGKVTGTESLTGAFADLGAPWVTGIDDLDVLAEATGWRVADRTVFADFLGDLQSHRMLDASLSGSYSGAVFEVAR